MRVVAGLGLGGSSVVVPMYSSEMTPKELRGQIGSFYQLMFTFGRFCKTSPSIVYCVNVILGIFISYWVNYDVAQDMTSTTAQWQIPIGLQLLPAGLLGLGMFTLKESVRWLTRVGRHGEAWESLKWVRADDGPDTQDEMEEICAGVALEARATEGFRMKGQSGSENGGLAKSWD